MQPVQEQMQFPLNGSLQSDHPALLGVFDGMGGEECGEVAAWLAAKESSEVVIGDDPTEELSVLCRKANYEICRYAEQNGVLSMGTTAALLAFGKREIGLCNIGDSRIFRLRGSDLKQLSVDHVAVAAYGRKPPLSQNLGIPPSEMVIEPYVCRHLYQDGDQYLLCSDGLTDMVSPDDIRRIMTESTEEKTVGRLVKAALAHGGRDNITVILCKITAKKRKLFSNTTY
ncbi:MAG: serine/threonine-protein phosphatase [Clostridiales bacterium]|nr:serine/threonine-protein phosphatase [Clostridiales bacterium]